MVGYIKNMVHISNNCSYASVRSLIKLLKNRCFDLLKAFDCIDNKKKIQWDNLCISSHSGITPQLYIDEEIDTLLFVFPVCKALSCPLPAHLSVFPSYLVCHSFLSIRLYSVHI